MLEAVIWDFGGVLTTSPFEAFARSKPSAGCPPTSSGAPMRITIGKMPGRNSSAPKWASKPSINCSPPNRLRSARRFGARTFCRCCREICGLRWSRRSGVSGQSSRRVHHQQSSGQHDRKPRRPIALRRGSDGAVRSCHRVGQDRPPEARSRIYRMMVEKLGVDPRLALISTTSESTSNRRAKWA